MAQDKNAEVGYGKPPVATQFKPGQSGNPKGRPKGQPKLEQLIMAELASIVQIKEGQTIKARSKKQVIVQAVAFQAMKGNLQAAKLLFSFVSQIELADIDLPEEVSAYDLETLKHHLAMKAED